MDVPIRVNERGRVMVGTEIQKRQNNRRAGIDGALPKAKIDDWFGRFLGEL